MVYDCKFFLKKFLVNVFSPIMSRKKIEIIHYSKLQYKYNKENNI